MKHTKGQWRTKQSISFTNCKSIIVNSESIFELQSNVGKEETEANAILIAASPIMLEALIEISGIVATGVNISSCQTIAMNAIKKATL